MRRCAAAAGAQAKWEVSIIGIGSLVGIVALIWLTHIGVDRLVGYGLKYPTSPKDTHLQRV